MLLIRNSFLHADSVFIERARNLVLKGNFTGAISYLKSWEKVKLSPADKASLYIEEGKIYLYYLHFSYEAVYSFQNALKYATPYSKEYLHAFFGLSQAYTKEGKKKKAMSILKNLKKFYSGRPEMASIEYMIKEIKRIKHPYRQKVPRKEKRVKKLKRILPANVMIKVKIGNGSLWKDFVPYEQEKIRIYLPGGVSSEMKWGEKINPADFPMGTTITISSTSEVVYFKKNPYRGILILFHKHSAYWEVINFLPIEDYLKGVLPWEISPCWPMETLEAQAVAARTYALYHFFQKNEYDLESTIVSQVYKGMKIENPRTNQAILKTRGEILTYNELPILAYFHSCDGGIKEIPKNVWGVEFPYFRRGIDPWCMRHPQKWKSVISLKEINKKVRKSYPFIRKIYSISLQKENMSVRYVLLHTTEGVVKIGANNFRLAMGPSIIKSAIFSIKRRNKSYIFRGRGYGHGVGLSQWGAYYMAEKGKSYREILSFYYPGTKITTIKKLFERLSISSSFP